MKKINVSVFEDNGGGITAIVETDGKITNIITGFEDGTMDAEKFIEAAKEGFDQAYDYDPDNWSGLTIEQAAEEIKDLDDLIAEITGETVSLYPEQMGIAGNKLFGEEVTN